jgi:hypothetical protein
VVVAEAMPVGSRREGSAAAFAVVLTLLFVLVCAFTLPFHEMWRDELQAWLIARDSRTLGDLFAGFRYEGHPAVWYLLLYGVTRFTHRPEAMQVLHLAIAALAVFVFARAAPFPKWAKLLFSLGYFTVYEYGVIARNYSLGLVFLYAAAALFPRRRDHPWALGLLLGLAAHTSVLALLVSAAFAGTVLVEPFLEGEARARITPAAKTFGLAFVVMLIAYRLVQLPADSGFAEPLDLEWSRLRLEQILGAFSQALLPIPGGRSTWGELWLETVSHHVAPALTFVLGACMLPYFIRRKVGFVMLAAGSSVLLFFFYTRLDGSLRHHGFFFVNLVLAVWLAEAAAAEQWATAVPSREKIAMGPLFASLAMLVLVLHAVLAAVSVGQDVALRFSAGRATAALLEAERLDEAPLVGDRDYSLPPVLGYLGQRTVYYPYTRRFGSFVRLDTVRRRYWPTDEEIFEGAREMARTYESPVGVVLNRITLAGTSVGAEILGCIASDVVLPESYCVYRVPHPSDSRTRSCRSTPARRRLGVD